MRPDNNSEITKYVFKVPFYFFLSEFSNSYKIKFSCSLKGENGRHLISKSGITDSLLF